MTGGTDTFVVEAQAVSRFDRVKDFENSMHKIDLPSFSLGSFADAQARASDTASDLKLPLICGFAVVGRAHIGRF